jgi:hypothetical protein
MAARRRYSTETPDVQSFVRHTPACRRPPHPVVRRRRRPEARRADAGRPQVKVGKLANGLTYYIQKNTRPERKLELRLVVKAGSILEDEDQQGLAHFVEHMAFNGIDQLPEARAGRLPAVDRRQVRRRPECLHLLRRNRLRAADPDRPSGERGQGVPGAGRLGARHHLRRSRDRQGARHRARRTAARQRRGDRIGKQLCRRSSTARAMPSACRSGRKKSCAASARGAAPLLPRLVPARPDGGGRGRRHRSESHRKAGQGAFRQADQPEAGASPRLRRDPRREQTEAVVVDRRKPAATAS